MYCSAIIVVHAHRESMSSPSLIPDCSPHYYVSALSMSQQLQQTQSSIPTLYTVYVYTVEAQDCIRQLLQFRPHPKSISLYLQRYLLYTYAISLSIQMIYSTCRNTLCNGNCSHLCHTRNMQLTHLNLVHNHIV